MSMKVLVTGATGFIGSNVVKELLKRNYKVRIFLRKKAITKNVEGLNVEVKYGDILDDDSLKRAMEGCDYIIHCASLYSFWYPASDFVYRVNVDGTRNVLKFALQFGVRRVVFTSTAMTHGISYEEGDVRDERSDYNLNEGEDAYVHSKYLAERVCAEYVEKGLDVVIVNPTFPLGEGDIRPSPMGFVFLSFLNGESFGSLKGGANFVNVKDVAVGHILALERGRAGEKYILGGENMRFSEFFDRILITLRLPFKRRSLPSFFGRLKALKEELKTIFRMGSPPLTLSTYKLWNYFLFYSSDKSIKELTYNPGAVDEGIVEGAKWFLENGYIKKKREHLFKDWK